MKAFIYKQLWLRLITTEQGERLKTIPIEFATTASRLPLSCSTIQTAKYQASRCFVFPYKMRTQLFAVYEPRFNDAIGITVGLLVQLRLKRPRQEMEKNHVKEEGIE